MVVKIPGCGSKYPKAQYGEEISSLPLSSWFPFFPNSWVNFFQTIPELLVNTVVVALLLSSTKSLLLLWAREVCRKIVVVCCLSPQSGNIFHP
jgi:hypothetical protein